jgi:hypothetical protein
MKRPAILVLILLALAGAYAFATRGESRAPRTATGLDDIKRQVVTDAIAQYDIAKRNGSAMDRCTQASAVKAAVMQAQDEAGFVRWKKVEGEECAALTAP